MVGGPGTVKRLRVRLRATDPTSLAKTFGSNIFESGLFLRSPHLLDVGTPVLVEVLYQNGVVALRGRGTVQDLRNQPESGMRLALDWVDGTRSLARWVVGQRGPSLPVETSEEAHLGDDEDDDPFEDVTVYAGDGPPETWVKRVAEQAASEAPSAASPEGAPLEPEPEPQAEPLQPPEPAAPPPDPTVPPPPVLPPELSVSAEPAEVLPAVGAAPNAGGAWDLISDLIDGPAPPAPEPVVEPVAPSGPPAEEPADERNLPTSELEREALVDAFDAADSSEVAHLPPAETGYAFNSDVSSDEIDVSGVRESGEVTPLARIELVRSPPSRPIRTSDIKPLELPAEEDGRPSTAIPSKKSKPPMPERSARIMAIDLGTSNTRAAISDSEEPRIIESRRGTESVPSAVVIRESGKTIVGEPALRKLTSHPESAILDIRRLIGLPFESSAVQGLLDRVDCTLVGGDEGETAVSVGALAVSLEEIAALLLKEIRESALMALNEKVNRAVLTCPITFGHRQREALLVACELAGVHVERFVAEPVAAAVHFAADRRLKNRTLFVFRLGGGTFDATVLRVDGDRYTVVAAAGDQLLGGLSLDAALAPLLADEVLRSSGLDPRTDPGAMAGVRLAAREAKHLLSASERASLFVEPEFGGKASFRVDVEVSREQAELLWAPFIDRTIQIAEQVCEVAGIQPRDVDDLILAGGQVASPVVRRRLHELFDKKPVELDAVHAAVLGAAEIAVRLETERAFEIEERLARAIGIWVDGGGYTSVLPRNAPLPAEGSFLVKPAFANKGRAELFVSEGEGEERREPIGLIRIEPVVTDLELTLSVGTDGLLQVTAHHGDAALPVKLVTDLRSVRRTAAEEASKKDGGLFGWIKKRFKNSRASAEK